MNSKLQASVPLGSTWKRSQIDHRSTLQRGCHQATKAAARPPPKQQQQRQTSESEPSVIGASLLVAGTAVGAGILALPAVTQDSGFVASAAALVGGGAYSIATGLLLAELYVNATNGTPAAGGAGGDGDGDEAPNGTAAFAGIARSTLGQGGVLAGATAYAFLHVALLVAYISKSAEIICAATGLGTLPGAALFVAALGGLVYFASPPALDRVNGLLVGLICASFLGLLGSAAAGVEPSALLRADWGAVPGTLPVVALSFVYHNVVPVICTSLKGDAGKIRTAIIGGVALPMVMFVMWDGAILGSLDSLGSTTTTGTSSAAEATTSTTSTTSSSTSTTTSSSSAGVAPAPALAEGPPGPRGTRPRVDDPLAALSARDAAVGLEIGAFSFLAVATSFIGFVLGLTDFVAGALGLPSRNAPAPYALALLPPLALAVSFPGIFLSAIDTAGTYGVLTLFGLLPCAMAWSARYNGGGLRAASQQQQQQRVELVPGGKPVILLLSGCAGAVILNEVVEAVHRVL